MDGPLAWPEGIMSFETERNRSALRAQRTMANIRQAGVLLAAFGGCWRSRCGPSSARRHCRRRDRAAAIFALALRVSRPDRHAPLWSAAARCRRA